MRVIRSSHNATLKARGVDELWGGGGGGGGEVGGGGGAGGFFVVVMQCLLLLTDPSQLDYSCLIISGGRWGSEFVCSIQYAPCS